MDLDLFNDAELGKRVRYLRTGPVYALHDREGVVNHFTDAGWVVVDFGDPIGERYCSDINLEVLL